MSNVGATDYKTFRAYHCPDCNEAISPDEFPSLDHEFIVDPACGSKFTLADVWVTYFDEQGDVCICRICEPI